MLLTYGHRGRSSQSMLQVMAELAAPEDRAYGHFGAPAGYALAARRAMHELGTGPQTWEHIAMGQRKWAQLNPTAQTFGQPMGQEDYLASRMTVEPFRLLDCCLLTDGGRALVLTTLERARDCPHTPVTVLGLGHHSPSARRWLGHQLRWPTGGREAAFQAMGQAGIGLDAVDACQIYDCFTYTVEVTLQDYGFFQPGEGRDWFQGGTMEPGGRLPVNTSGGLLSEAYFMGLTPLSEAAMQLMGRCGQRQLGPNTGTREPEIMLCSDNGGILHSHTCVVLGKGEP